MAGSVNKIILVGNLGKNPETRTFPDGGKVVTFSVAMSESWKDQQSGQRKERVEWANVSVWNDALQEISTRYLKKGSKVYLEGKLETRKWTDKEGIERYSTDVALRPFGSTLVLLDKKDDGDAAPSRPTDPPAQTRQRGTGPSGRR
jgi:single-strand DNA-binding protein